MTKKKINSIAATVKSEPKAGRTARKRRRRTQKRQQRRWRCVDIPTPTLPVAPTSNRRSFMATLNLSVDLAPKPFQETIWVEVNPETYHNFFTGVYNAIMNAIDTYDNNNPDGFITAEDFSRVCQYLLKTRVDEVYCRQTGRRVEHATPVPRDFRVPKSIGDAINNVGSVVIREGGLFVSPCPATPPSDSLPRPGNGVSDIQLSSFSALVRHACALGIIADETLSVHLKGTSYWLLSARTEGLVAVAQDSGVVRIKSAFKEFTPNDAILAAIVQNGFDGVIATSDFLLWTTAPITEVPGLRGIYALQA